MRRLLATTLAFLSVAALMPRILCDPASSRWWAGDLATQRALADAVARDVLEADSARYYHTGLPAFDEHASVATDQMAALGLGQVVLAHPELRDRYLPAIRAAADHLADPRQLTYAAAMYGRSGLVEMDRGEGHAYLGYAAMGLAMARRVDPEFTHGPLLDRVIAGLTTRLVGSSTGLIETWPGQTFPPDVAAVAGAIGLNAAATGRSVDLGRWEARFRRCAVEPGTGWLRQRTSGCGAGAPRGSGTSLAAYFLGYAAPDLARELAAAEGSGERRWLGFGAIREYPSGWSGAGDYDSGPVLLGVSVGATGWGLGAARAGGDRPRFQRLYRTARLFGVSMPDGDARSFAAGGALGNAMLLAMLTGPTP